ncbi:hypothetical protein Bca52824_030859 [Brassica carinata]|uniref:CCHC-type domain-containing protein n=1 Tax=Brassica carinata TaxID=52824 RepID=A0A8X7S9Y4_BRACI|nr:hypothetical protein Bca52824_030859 [Brassica carinata]
MLPKKLKLRSSFLVSSKVVKFVSPALSASKARKKAKSISSMARSVLSDGVASGSAAPVSCFPPIAKSGHISSRSSQLASCKALDIELPDPSSVPVGPQEITIPPVPIRNYASVLKDSAMLEELGSPTEHITGVPFVLIPDENIEAAKEEFKDFLYASFHGDVPPMGRIIGVVNAVWAKTGPRIFVHRLGKGAFLLRVTNPKTRETLLSRSCWNITGLPMFVSPWSPDFAPEEAPITSAIVPVELRNVPYLLFNNESLGRLATAVGRPVSVAPETQRKENFQVAKLFVKVDLLKRLPDTIVYGFSNGREFQIDVSYPWLPIKCELCGKYGHKKEECRVEVSIAYKGKNAGPSFNMDTIHRRSKSRPGRSRAVKPISGSQVYVPAKATPSVQVIAPDPPAAQVDEITSGVADGKDATIVAAQVDEITSGVADGKDATIVAAQVDEITSGVADGKDATIVAPVAIVMEDDTGVGHAESAVTVRELLAPDPSGLNSDRRHTMIKDWINIHKPLFGAFLETHILENNNDRVLRAIPPGWKFFGNYQSDASGRIILVWDPRVSVFIYHESAQSVTCGVVIPSDNISITVSFVYAFNDLVDRAPLWDSLVDFQASTPVSRFPWAVIGDFNQILRVSHHSNHASGSVDTSGIEEINLSLQDAELFEAQAKGLPFTWRNNQDDNPISTKIDHAFINQFWTSSFPDSYAEYLEPNQSDHAPCLFHLPSVRRWVCKPFKFFPHVTDHPEYSQIVSEAWNCSLITGTDQFKLVRSLKLLKVVLRRLNKRNFSGISQRVKDQKVIVDELQRSLLTLPDSLTAREEHIQREKLNVLLTAEEKYYRQRSRVRWADVGDRNTVFYHSVVTHHVNRNHIHFLKDGNDRVISSTDELKSHSAQYFQNILGITDLPISLAPFEELQNLLPFRSVMTVFKDWSGLDMNEAKSEIYYGGYNDIQASVLADLSGFKRGSFPTRYLGLPLDPKKITFATMQPFLDRITSKLHSWTVKTLTFAGKVKLIYSVIYGMVNFWSSVFVLPKRFYQKVDSICSAFLWKNSTTSAAGARVSWSSICTPKKEGGLGLRTLEEFDLVFRLKRLWNFFSNSGSLWVAWLAKNRFNGKSFWLVRDSQRFSVTVRSMLQLKYLLPTFLRCSVGNGNTASFWFDFWTDLGPLHLLFGSTASRTLRLPISASVSEAVRDGHWNLPPARSENVVTLQIVLSTMPVPSPSDANDSYLWRSQSGGFGSTFSSSVTWNLLRQRSPIVEWHEVVWFREEIPRCSFITWLTVLQRLPTRDRLISWGLTVPDTCVLCFSHVESHQHLFFECSYAAAIWSMFCSRFISSPPSDISSSVSMCLNYNGIYPSQVKIIMKLLLQVIVYSLWRERNGRIFRDLSHQPMGLFRIVDRQLRDRLLSLRPGPTDAHSLLELYFWFIAPFS